MLVLTSTSTALARAYFSEVAGDVTLRCSSVPSTTLPDEVVSRYGISVAPTVGVLSCAMQRRGSDGTIENLSGRVSGQVVTLTGVSESPAFRAVLEDEAVSYLATYAIPLDGPLTYQISVRPDGSDEAIRIEHQDIRPQQ